MRGWRDRVRTVIQVAAVTLLATGGMARAALINSTPADGGITVTMTQNGGNVMTGHVQTFAIYYGDFTSANAGNPKTVQQVVQNWLTNFAGTTYANIAST